MIGGSLNTENETHTLYAGLDWMYQFDSRVFITGSFGFAYHTGNLEQEERQCAPGENCSLPGNRAYVDTGKVTLGSQCGAATMRLRADRDLGSVNRLVSV